MGLSKRDEDGTDTCRPGQITTVGTDREDMVGQIYPKKTLKEPGQAGAGKGRHVG